MAYRAVAMWEVLNVLRRVGRGESRSAVARATGHDRKTVKRYVDGQGVGLEAGGGRADGGAGGSRSGRIPIPHAPAAAPSAPRSGRRSGSTPGLSLPGRFIHPPKGSTVGVFGCEGSCGWNRMKIILTQLTVVNTLVHVTYKVLLTSGCRVVPYT